MSTTPINPRSLMFLLASLALISLPHIQHLPLPLYLFFAASLIWRVLGIWHPRYLPNRWLLLLFTLMGLTLLISEQHGFFGRDAGTSLFLVALGLKLLEIHSRREIYLVVYLAFIVGATQFLYENTLWMAAYMLGVSVSLLASLVLQNADQIRPSLALKTATSLILQSLPLAIVIFVLFPRLEAPRWHWLEDDQHAQSGLSNTLEPGSISELSLSDERVFRVHFDGPLPPPAQRYWRGPVYSVTDGIRWTASRPSSLTPAALQFSGQAYTYTLMMEPQKEAWVFALEMPSQVEPALPLNTAFQLIHPQHASERTEYKLTSYSEYVAPAAGRQELEENLQLPDTPSPRLSELVTQLQGFDAPPEQFIQNLLQHFRQEKFYYTLTPPLMPNNPIETFLFESRSGFCSHYATAFVYLLRIAHVPARVVGGYQGGEYNKVGDFLDIRQADAHAWAEVWLGDKGWVRVDPTAAIAPERIERGINVDLQIATGAVNFAPFTLSNAPIDWLKRSRQLWQSLDYHWQRWVINYNPYQQMQFLQRLGIEDLIALAKWLLMSTAVLGGSLAWVLLGGSKEKMEPALQQYRRFCRQLAKVGVEPKPGEGPYDFAKRAKSSHPEMAQEIEEITRIFLRLRYEEKSTQHDLQDLKTKVKALRIKPVPN